MSTSNWYNEIEAAIANLTSEGLLKALNQFKGVEREILLNLFIKKISKNKNFRPLVFYAGYCLAKGNNLINLELLSEKERQIIRDVTTAIEVENIATYYINHYLDKKSDILNSQDEKNRVIAGVMCRNIQQDIIEQLELAAKIKLKILKILREIDQDIAKAQVYEVNTGIINNLSQFKNEEEFLTTYFERCRKISGQFYGRCAEIGYIIGSNNAKLAEAGQKIKDFYTEMATIGQFGNDIGDYALANTHSGTLEKNYYKDYGSDLKNQRLTYPNYLLLKRITEPADRNLISSIIENGFNDQSMSQFITLMNKLNIFKDCLTLLNKRFNTIKKTLAIPQSELRTLVSSSVIVIKSNKLISSVKKTIPEKK